MEKYIALFKEAEENRPEEMKCDFSIDDFDLDFSLDEFNFNQKVYPVLFGYGAYTTFTHGCVFDNNKVIYRFFEDGVECISDGSFEEEFEEELRKFLFEKIFSNIK